MRKCSNTKNPGFLSCLWVLQAIYYTPSPKRFFLILSMVCAIAKLMICLISKACEKNGNSKNFKRRFILNYRKCHFFKRFFNITFFFYFVNNLMLKKGHIILEPIMNNFGNQNFQKPISRSDRIFHFTLFMIQLN